MKKTITEIMQSSPVIPVITIQRIEDAVPLAAALVDGGLKTLEITLRTSIAIKALALIKAALPQAIVGAGTIINSQLFDEAVKAGAEFIVTPGSTPSLIAASRQHGVPLLPGVNTPSEIMSLLEQDITAMKFFPAEAAGGTPMLKALSAPLPQAIFCPTGGITPSNAQEYLTLSNVACVGGTWMVKDDLIQASAWSSIRALAKTAASLSLGVGMA